MAKTGEPNERLGRYELLRPLGQGGMAEVFLAKTDSVAGFSKQLAIKRVLPAFVGEALLAARLSHPNICQVFELGEVNGQYFIAMEHVPGSTHNELLKRARPQPMPVVAAGPQGTLVVDSEPRARVSIGGRALGTTPLRVPFAVGTHRLRIDDAGGSHQLIINVLEGRETTIKDTAD